jgi:hypothetical protein
LYHGSTRLAPGSRKNAGTRRAVRQTARHAAGERAARDHADAIGAEHPRPGPLSVAAKVHSQPIRVGALPIATH